MPRFLRLQIEALEARLIEEHPNWLAFCHNDLQCGNVMLDASSLARLSNSGGIDGSISIPVVCYEQKPHESLQLLQIFTVARKSASTAASTAALSSPWYVSRKHP